MDFRKIKVGMKVSLTGDLKGTISKVEILHGKKVFYVLWDNTVINHNSWTTGPWKKENVGRMDFKIAQYNADFDELLKGE